VVSLPTFREHFANMVKLMKLKQNRGEIGNW